MEHCDIILSIALLVLAFILKLSIGRSVDIPNFIEAIFELPVDTEFLAISFLVAFTIIKDADTGKGLVFCIVLLVIAAIIIIFWRLCSQLFEKGNKWWIFLLLINLLLSIISLYGSIEVLVKRDVNVNTKINTNKNEENGNK